MDDDEETYETVEEAIAVALSELDPDGVLTIHALDCESEDGETNCTCVPLVLTRGAQA